MTTKPTLLTQAEQDFWCLIQASVHKLSRTMDETLQAGSALSSAEFAVLSAIAEADDHALRLRELCTALKWDRSRTSHQVTRMERRGLVRKEKSPGDARGILISLTDEGERRFEAAAPAHVEFVRRLIFDHMHAQDSEAVTRFLNGILAAETVAAQKAARPA